MDPFGLRRRRDRARCSLIRGKCGEGCAARCAIRTERKLRTHNGDQVISPRATAGSRLAFAVGLCAIFASTGGIFAMAPTVVASVFGAGQAAQIYSVLFTAFVTASICGGILTKKLLTVASWDTVFMLMAAASAMSIVVNTQLKIE